MIKLFASLLFILPLTFVNAQAKLDTSNYAIIKFELSNPHPFGNKYKAAELELSEIIEAENILSICANNYNKLQMLRYNEIIKRNPKSKSRPKIASLVIDLPRYKRQYVAVINSKGEKEIWINCFCTNFGIDWRHTIVNVDDGGNCFFNVRVNLTTKQYFNFMVNGYA